RRPGYHFLAPAGMMNDPNGPIFFGGKWHMFYQHNPYGNDWGPVHWGHAVSSDLVRWDHWPIALAPSIDRAEEGCWSGCCVAVLGGHRDGGNGCALIYKSPDLVHWQFLNVLMEGAEKNWECPNFFKLGDKWVLIYSPHGPVRYYTGTLTKDYKFVPEYQGTLD